MEFEKLNRRPWGKGRGKIVSNREGGKPQETLKYREQTGLMGRRLRERGKWVMGIEEGNCWDEHWLYESDESWESTPEAKIYTVC